MPALKSPMPCAWPQLLCKLNKKKKLNFPIELKQWICKQRNGKPSARMVLLKDFDDKGFVFFTNYTSKKGQELAENPQASLCFYWDIISRQVRVDGKVVKISREESESYFSKRPLNSRVSAYISDQSKVIKNKEVQY